MPNIEFLTERRFTLSSHLIEVALKNNLSLIEFLLLMYFEDTTDKTFDVKKICEVLNITEQDALKAFNQLLTLNLIEIESSKDKSNKHCEEISLVPIYRTMFENLEQKEQKKKKETIFDMFQKELGRNISPMEYEIINAWLEHNYSEELIVGALKEAVYNGVKNLRYIDKILFEWNKKGFKTMADINNHLEKRNTIKKEDSELFDYNWLDDED